MLNPSNKPPQIKLRINQHKRLQINDPKIDKLAALTYKWDSQAVKDIEKHLFDGIFRDAIIIPESRSKTTTAFNLYTPPRIVGEASFMEIQTTPSQSRIRFQFNPAEMNEQRWHLMNRWTQDYLSCDNFPGVLIDTKVTRLDICRDIHGMFIEDYFFKMKHARARDNFKKDHTGVLGTIVFGVSTANQFTIYNKAAQQGLNPYTAQPWTRVEYKYRPDPALYMSDLRDIKNPFPKLEIYGLDAEIIEAIPPEYFIWFMDSCRFRGVAGALKAANLEDKFKGKVTRQLKERLLPLWASAQKDWDGKWDDALRKANLYETVMSSTKQVKGEIR